MTRNSKEDLVNICVDNLNFEQILAYELQRFKRESNKHKNQYRTGQTIIISLMTASSCVAAIASLKTDYAAIISIVNVFLSSTAVAVNTWLKMQKCFELWKTETVIYHELADIKREIDFECTSGTWNPEKQANAFKRMNNAIKMGNTDWKRIQTN